MEHPGSTPVSTILFNGQVSTLDPSQPKVSALAIAGGRLVSLGDDADVVALREPGTTLVDLDQRRVIPGLCDAHCHFLHSALRPCP